MKYTEVGKQNCAIAKTLAVVGDPWTLLVLRQAFLGLKRFDEYHETLGISRNVLAERLGKLVEAGVFDRVKYDDRPPSYEYHLTERGLDLYPVIVSLLNWGDRHVMEHGPSAVLVHKECDHPAETKLVCSHCGEEIAAHGIRAELGPSAHLGCPLRDVQELRERQSLNS